MLLAKPRVQGSFAVSTNADEQTVLVRTPPNAAQPAEVTVTHPGVFGIVYLAWHESETGKVRSTDRALVLEPGDAKTWRNPPRNSFLKALASEASVSVDVDAVWSEVNVAEVEP